VRGISILMYHQVGDFPPMKAHRSTYCLRRRFAAQMALLSRLRCPVLPFDEALDALAGGRPVPQRAVVLTFDDGCENFYEHAFPVLKRYRFPAIVYLVSGLVGKRAEWFAADGRTTPPLMDRERILGLVREGIAFGSHGMGHMRLSGLDQKTLHREIARSKTDLESLLGIPIRHFCFPYGSHDEAAVAMVRRAGYASAVTCVRGAALPGEDPFQLPRKAISYGDSLAGFLWKILFKNRRKTPPLQVPEKHGSGRPDQSKE